MHLTLFVLVSLGLLFSFVLRFLPRANGIVSGRPEPIRRFTVTLAENFAAALKNSPVLLIKEIEPACEKPVVAKSFKGDRLYIALRYSENPPLLCETLYANAAPDSNADEIVSLSESSGRNYGAQLTTPAKVVAVGYSFIRYPNDLPEVLDWHTKEDPLYTLEGKTQVEESFPDQITLSLNSAAEQPILGLRDLVASQHDAANTVLLWCIGLFGLASVVSGVRLWMSSARAQGVKLREIAGSGTATLANVPVEVVGWQGRKRILAWVVRVDLLLIAVFLLTRFTPSWMEWLVGSGDFVRVLTKKFAQVTAAAEGPQFPVLLIDGEDSCRPIRTTKVIPKPNAMYYMLSYSEKLGLSCWTVYVAPLNGMAPPGVNWVKVSGDQGKNYGAPLHGPVQVIPFERIVKIYNPVYVGLLHWRTEAPAQLPADFVAAKNFPPGNHPVDLEAVQFFKTKVDLAEMRAGVAQSYRRVSFLLFLGTGVAVLILFITVERTRQMYRRFSFACQQFGFAVDWSTFVATDADALLECARQGYLRRQEEAREKARAESVLRRSKEEIEGKLNMLLHTLTDEASKDRIREYLRRGQMEEMEALWLELQAQPRQAAPESRLDSLLDSSREYCAEDEFERVRAEAFAILAKSGFREAREFAVKQHSDLRKRAKALEKSEDPDQEEQQEQRGESPNLTFS